MDFALAKVASSLPHAAYCAFTHGMMGHWVYLIRTIHKIKFLISATGQTPPSSFYMLLVTLLNMTCLFRVILVGWVWVILLAFVTLNLMLHCQLLPL